MSLPDCWSSSWSEYRDAERDRRAHGRSERIELVARELAERLPIAVLDRQPVQLPGQPPGQPVRSPQAEPQAPGSRERGLVDGLALERVGLPAGEPELMAADRGRAGAGERADQIGVVFL